MSEEVKEILPRTPEDFESVDFQIMDQADEEEIFKDIKGMMADNADKWIYEFNSGGKTVRGLSWVGTKEFRFWLAEKKKARITELPELGYMKEVDHGGQKYIDVKVVMKDLDTEIVASATVRQGYVRKGGGMMDVEFVPRIAESKAQRNAIQKIIPASTMAEFIAMARDKGMVQVLVAKKGVLLSPEDMELGKQYLSEIEQLVTIAECKEYWIKLSKLTKNINGKLMYNLKQAVSTKAENIKKKAAEAKVKNMAQAPAK